MAATRPNVLVITTHDSGCHFGCYGVPAVRTPHIDRLAAEGVRMERMFAAAPICSPSRGALLTGQWPIRNGLAGLAGSNWEAELDDPATHLSHRLRAAGYETVLAGIQHETADIDTLGFDHHLLAREEEGVDRSAPACARAAAAWLESRPAGEETPFYIQLGFFETHTPYEKGGCEPDAEKGTWVPPYAEAETPADDALREHLARFQGSLRRADEGVGIVLDALRARGLEENTLVLFNTDHGPELPRAKWTHLDAGMRIAFVLRWPAGGITGGRTVDALLGNVDFVPTLAEWIGFDLNGTIDGVSFADALRDPSKAAGPFRDAVFGVFIYEHNYSVRTERYKLIRNFEERACNRYAFHGLHTAPPVELFDLEADPLETKDVAADPEYAEVRASMEDRLWRWLESANPDVLRGPLPVAAYRRGIADYAAYRKARDETAGQ